VGIFDEKELEENGRCKPCGGIYLHMLVRMQKQGRG